MFVGMAALAKEGSTVMLITLAQAFTVIGIPALALALVYLGTRKDLTGDRRVPRPILALAILGFLVSCMPWLALRHGRYGINFTHRKNPLPGHLINRKRKVPWGKYSLNP